MPTSNFKSAYKYLLRRGVSGSYHQSPGTTLKLFFNKRRRVHTTGYRGTQSQPQSNPDHHQHHQGHFMPRRTSTNSSGNDEPSEKGTPTLPTLTRAQHRRFIVEQRIIISALIEDYSLEHAVFYTTVDIPQQWFTTTYLGHSGSRGHNIQDYIRSGKSKHLRILHS